MLCRSPIVKTVKRLTSLAEDALICSAMLTRLSRCELEGKNLVGLDEIGNKKSSFLGTWYLVVIGRCYPWDVGKN